MCIRDRTYMKKADRSGVKIADIKEEFPDALCDLNIIEKCLEHISTPFMNDLNREVKFKLSNAYLKYYDPFMQYMKVATSDQLLFALRTMRSVKEPERFDFLFGELALEEKDLCESLIPFRVLLRERFKKSEMSVVMMKILASSKTGIITPWMIRCALKVLLCCFPKSTETMNCLNINFSRVLVKNESTKEIIESYKAIFGRFSASTEEAKHGEGSANQKLPRKLSKEIILTFKARTLEDYKQKVIAFQSKNKTILHDISKWARNEVIYICGSCRHSVSPSTYTTCPYGKLVYTHKSRVYGRHLRQLLKLVKRKVWAECELKAVDGVTRGKVLTSCGHYIHEKCWKEILSKPPRNDVCSVDAKFEPRNALCPLCRVCANNLLVPHEVLTHDNTKAIERVKERLLSEMQEEVKEDSVCGFFRLICNYITYQLHLIDLTNVADFSIKEDCINTLVQYLELSIRLNPYEELIAIKDCIKANTSFLFSNLAGLFEVDLLSIFTQIIVGARLLESKSTTAKVREEFTDKCEAIIKLATIQIVFAIASAELANTPISHKDLHTSLQEPNVTSLISNRRRIEKRLFPFVKKLVCARHLLFPNENVKENIAKAGWVAEPREIGFYLRILGVRQDLAQCFLCDSVIPCKAAFFPFPDVNKQWMYSCFSELLNSIKQDAQVFNSRHWPLLVTYKAATKKFSLFQLPQNFNALLSHYKECTCKSGCGVKTESAVCLLCGELLCAASTCCLKNSIGELTWHAQECENGCGLYLKLSNNKVILLDKGQACTYQSPYVSRYEENVKEGEESLVLEQRIVEELKELYLAHNIPQKTRIISLKSFKKFKPFSL
eukprot:TRINITY_DN12140_c0_g1_i25.p1 TRINITY_DN12140_c0_g1~~TRINITY_DN12140_c0_g1_i25.p1  ORF type:complete len:837 (+),score=182.99 TRINITY_DN12140_c0_g1_i25:73-2583(+)